MKKRRHISLSLLLVCLLMPAVGRTQVPAVHKIEPPNWWVNFTPELRLLLTGENLSLAQVESQTRNLDVVSTEGSANGHYLFIRLKMNPSLMTGTARLRLHTPSGATDVQLPLSARADARGHFDGVSRDDVIYLIMPDRFADGDLSNDRPPGATGTYDRSIPWPTTGAICTACASTSAICTISA